MEKAEDGVDESELAHFFNSVGLPPVATRVTARFSGR
jgi:hypothetical protein